MGCTKCRRNKNQEDKHKTSRKTKRGCDSCGVDNYEFCCCAGWGAGYAGLGYTGLGYSPNRFCGCCSPYGCNTCRPQCCGPFGNGSLGGYSNLGYNTLGY